MGLIKTILQKLFPGKQQQPEKTIYVTNEYLAKIRQEEEIKIKATEQRIRNWLVASLKEKGDFPFSWESGNDEAFITFQHSTEAEESIFWDLEEYILLKLHIPSAGEFCMTGNGTIYIENELVKAKYNSSMKVLLDFIEETEEEVYGNEEHESRDVVLFKI